MGRMGNPRKSSRINPIPYNMQKRHKEDNMQKGKQPEHPIHKITIIECPTCGKMVEENEDHYCPLAREIDPTIFTDKLW